MPALDPQDAALFVRLTSVAIDTIWGVLDTLGYRDTFIEGVRAIHSDPNRKMAGRAMTMRYLPIRKDLAEAMQAKHEYGINIRSAEESKPGTVMVVEAGGETGGGFWGDVIATRFIMNGGVGVVTDGAIRDIVQLRAMNLAIYVREPHPAASFRRMIAVDYNIPIRCSGVTVLPGDFLVGDAEGVIVVPAHLASEVADKAIAVEAKENYLRDKLLGGASIYGVYPPNAATTKEYEEWKARQSKS